MDILFFKIIIISIIWDHKKSRYFEKWENGIALAPNEVYSHDETRVVKHIWQWHLLNSLI